MPEAELRREGKGIAIVGAFSPAIFHPSWFVDNELIRPDEAEHAEVQVVTSEVAAFSLSWMELQVTQQRLDLISGEAPGFEPLRDLAASIMRLLRGTRLRALGINHYSHYAVPKMPASLAHVLHLTDSQVWPHLESPEVVTLRFRGNRSATADEFPGVLGVEVAPSVPVKGGLFVGINDHYEFAGRDDDSGDWVQRVLADRWDESDVEARELAESIAKSVAAASNE